MKQRIIAYLLVAVTSTALTQAMLKAYEEKKDTNIIVVSKIPEEIFTRIFLLDAHNRIENPNTQYDTMTIPNSDKKPVEYKYPRDKKGIIVVSQKKDALTQALQNRESLLELRMNRDVEFKLIPHNCRKLTFRVSKGRLGSKLRISLDKSGSDCTPSRTEKAYKTASSYANKAAVKASKAGTWVADQGKAAYGSAKRAVGSGLESVRKKMQSTSERSTDPDETEY